MTLEFDEIDGDVFIEGDTDQVAGGDIGVGGFAMVLRKDHGGIGNDAFRKQKAPGQFCVIARRAHGDGNALFDAMRRRSVDESDLQWFFYHYLVVGVLPRDCIDLLHAETGDARVMGSGWMGHVLKLRKSRGFNERGRIFLYFTSHLIYTIFKRYSIMADLQIIQQIEKDLSQNLVRLEKEHSGGAGYWLNAKGQVEILSLAQRDIRSVGKIAVQLKKLRHLKTLNLQANEIVDISPLKDLKQVTKIYLDNNPIKDLSGFEDLLQLQVLGLGGCWLSDCSVIRELKNLVRLDLNDNSIHDISFLKDLTQLNVVSLDGNQIRDISPLKELKALFSLDLRRNPIEELPEWITEFKMGIEWSSADNLEFIYLYDNPIQAPPVEIVRLGKEAIRRYFERVREEGLDYIYEAKVILVGDGYAGKTSLQLRLVDEDAPLPVNSGRTRGIGIYDWEFKKVNGKSHIAHMWDFGGQDVYYPVHRFFLTENSVFVLLASTRQTQHNFDYWIPTIYQFGGKSPIILGQTCHDRNKVPWNDLGSFIGNSNFNIIKTHRLPYYEIDLPHRNEGLEEIRQVIIDQIIHLPHYGKGVPKSWVPIRNIMAIESKKDACITFEKFKELCRGSNPDAFSKGIDIEDCAKFLHSIGVVLWYYDNPELRNWVILQPEWAMNAVYKIIDDEEIQKRKGHILEKDFIRLWREDCYEDKHLVLKRMLEVFKIAFPKKHKRSDYILPARLYSIPNESKWQFGKIDPGNSYLRLEYRYEFMPKGMVNQLSAELSRWIANDESVWNNAVNFSNEDYLTTCQVEEDFYNRKISIIANGKDARGLVMLVMEALKNITDGYKGVEPEIYVPCTCSVCMKSPAPETFSYDKLLRKYASKENARVTCNESDESLLIEELLYNVGLPNLVKDKMERSMNKTIRLFLASSSELADDRKDFEIFIGRENKRLNREGVFIELVMWEDFIDAMSKTRLQDEYNKAVRDSDIFVSLFFTKVGKYTLEEFETAFGKLKETGRPFVYTYFKEAPVINTRIKKAEITSKDKFEKRLKSHGHYCTIYENIDNLQYQFKMQLEKILPQL
jgi:internalin A